MLIIINTHSGLAGPFLAVSKELVLLSLTLLEVRPRSGDQATPRSIAIASGLAGVVLTLLYLGRFLSQYTQKG